MTVLNLGIFENHFSIVYKQSKSSDISKSVLLKITLAWLINRTKHSRNDQWLYQEIKGYGFTPSIYFCAVRVGGRGGGGGGGGEGEGRGCGGGWGCSCVVILAGKLEFFVYRLVGLMAKTSASIVAEPGQFPFSR